VLGEGFEVVLRSEGLETVLLGEVFELGGDVRKRDLPQRPAVTLAPVEGDQARLHRLHRGRLEVAIDGRLDDEAAAEHGVAPELFEEASPHLLREVGRRRVVLECVRVGQHRGVEHRGVVAGAVDDAVGEHAVENVEPPLLAGP
jgi:hypothetical protein